MTETTESRLDRLEESLAHNDMTDSQLSDQLAKQWQVIDRLTHRLAELEEKMESLEAGPLPAPPADQPPPHY